MSFLFAIAGGSGSGKTTLARLLQERLGAERCHLISQDDYYFDIRDREFDGELPDFDCPESIDFTTLTADMTALKAGERITPPAYDFTTHQRVSSDTVLEPRPFIILEGILILNDRALRNVFDYALYLECPEALRFSRRRERDITERGRTPESVEFQLRTHVIPSHDRYVSPSRTHANRVISQDDYLQNTEAVCDSLIAISHQA